MTITRDKHNPHASLPSDSLALVGMIGEFVEAAGQAKDLPHLVDCVLATFSQQFGLSEASIWLRDVGTGQYCLAAAPRQSAARSLPPALPGDHILITCLAHTAGILRYQQERASPVNEALAAARACLCLPLRSHKGLLGFCVLGPLEANIHVSGVDLAVAETIARIACNALAHHMAQDDLRRSSLLIRRTDRLRSLEIMARGFAHEIRNPLTSIKTFIQLAPQRQQDLVFIKEFSQLAIEDVHRIERLLHEILDYASYMTPQPNDVDLNELVTSCLCFISASASQRGIRLSTALAPELPVLSLDCQQIKQVLLNLLLNALDAMPGGQGVIRVRTRLLPLIDGVAWVQLRVEDDGCGIAPEHLEHIFDPFFTTKHTNSAGDGSGLGLTTAHQIVQDHGGRLSVESRVGVGSAFSVDLPAPGMRTTVSAVRE